MKRDRSFLMLKDLGRPISREPIRMMTNKYYQKNNRKQMMPR